jgi:NADH-quinone oxidoreductase subunit L
MIVSGATAIAGLAIAYWFYLQRPGTADRLEEAAGPLARLFRGRWFIDDLYELVFVKGLGKQGGAWLAAWDRRVIDGGVNGAGWLTRQVGEISRWSDVWLVDGAVNLTALGVKLSSFPTRLLQTGLVQSYAFVIVAAMAALAGWYLMRSA